MVDSSDEDRSDENTQKSLNALNVKSTCNFGHDTIPGTSNAIGIANDIKMDNASFYEIVCMTMKKIENARTCEKSTDTGKKRANPHRTNAVPRKKSHDGEMCAGKLNNIGDLKTARPRRKDRKNVKKRERALSSESESSSRSESSR